jgi:hypothetical protein
MIRFFRKIRQQLLSENNYSMYLLYASGEIILVIMGILLALQIDDWNQIKTNKKEETKILSAFQEEFSQNKEDIITIKDHYAEIVKSGKLLIGLIGKKTIQVSQFNTDSIIAVSIAIEDYFPSDYVLSDMLSTGKLNLISSEKLRILLYEWTQEVRLKENAYEMLYKYFMESLIPYLTQNASLKNIDTYSSHLAWQNPSELENNSLEMFQDIVFENHLDNYIYAVSTYMGSLLKLEDLINQIINETKNKKTTKG